MRVYIVLTWVTLKQISMSYTVVCPAFAYMLSCFQIDSLKSDLILYEKNGFGS